MGILGWIILGLLVGLVAKVILPRGELGGAILTPIIGILGALIGGSIASAFGLGRVDTF
jgi:uncharacterized membrane protein YeaQ/YmgE (transglycosylase-associated protein family)